MKNLFFCLVVFVAMLTSCTKNGNMAFEKAIEDVYGSKVECVSSDFGNTYNYHYTMDFDDANIMVHSFLSLTYKIDSIMKSEYPSTYALPSYYNIRNSWEMEEQKPITFGNWHADTDTWTTDVDININTDASKISLSIFKTQK